MNGIIVIDKPEDYTSRDIVNIISKQIGTKKVGHTGTLDPLATGVLVIGVNKATKILELLFSDEKEYIAEVKMGILTDTLDITGNVLKEDYNFSITEDKIKQAFKHYQGKYMQEVPIYSAVKINGKKLYEYARNEEKVNLPKKEVNIKEIELLEFNEASFKFKCKVSKGTYIRSLIRDIGNYLNIYCTMSSLRRIKQGIFTIDMANNLEDIANNNFKFISLKDALINYKQIEVDDKLLFKIKNGQKLTKKYNEDIIVFTYKNEVIAIYEKSFNYYKAKKVLVV
ncbi:MAG: tRNA pseudouridine(55) synthase TruB [Bacilli bacterium]